MRYVLILLFAAITVVSCGKAPATGDTTTVYQYRLGDRALQFRHHVRPPNDSTLLYLVIHDNENTALEAGLQHIETFGGQLYELLHTGERLVTYFNGQTQVRFDPNRMFSDKGLEQNLLRLSPGALGETPRIRAFARDLSRFHLEGKKHIITLHNNTDRAFSIQSYRSDSLRVMAAEVHINPAMDEDDFVYTTEAGLFTFLQQKNINVVLQKPEPGEDDGSLSVHCGRLGIPYTNIEAEEGHMDEQLRLLAAVQEYLQQRPR